MVEQERLAELAKTTKFDYPFSQLPTRYYYGHGKLMITGEYVSLYGASVLAMPTVLGQNMVVRTRSSSEPRLYWKGIDCEGKVWFVSKFELWHFETEAFETGEIDQHSPVSDPDKVYYLQKLLRIAREINPHFLRDEEDVFVETRLEFSLDWGLGSSSSLIYNVAQWAYVSPFELSKRVSRGSAYDIACAQSDGPILYKLDLADKERSTPTWTTVKFLPTFKNNLYFVYRGNKKDTEAELIRFQALSVEKALIEKTAEDISKISHAMLSATDLEKFAELMNQHEELISAIIDIKPLKQLHYQDYWGSIKSLGAWGGDFAMVTSDRSEAEVRSYFEKNPKVKVLTYHDLFVSKKTQDLLH